jgi:hypothetical protein
MNGVAFSLYATMKASDMLSELFDRGEGGAAQRLASQDREPDCLSLFVQSAGARRRAIHPHLRYEKNGFGTLKVPSACPPTRSLSWSPTFAMIVEASPLDIGARRDLVLRNQTGRLGLAHVEMIAAYISVAGECQVSQRPRARLFAIVLDFMAARNEEDLDLGACRWRLRHLASRKIVEP